MAKQININGGIGFDFTAEILRDKLAGETGDIEINLNSAGGSVYDAFEIYNEIMQYRKINNAKVTIIINGLVASAAAYLSMAGTERVVYDNSVFMIHNAMIWAIGDHRVMEFWKEDLEKTDKVIATAYSKASGNPINEVLDFMSYGQDNNGTYFYGQEIVESGFATRVIDTDVDNDKDNSITESKMMILNFNKTLSKGEYDHDKVLAMLNSFNSSEPEKEGSQNNTIGETMDKKELLEKLNVLKTNAQITLPEIAQALGLEEQLVTDMHLNAIKVVNQAQKLVGDKVDIVDYIENSQKETKANAVKVRAAKLDESFGPKVFEDTKKENKARTYAGKILGNDELTEEKVNEIKADEIFKTLAAERADVDSDVNQIGISEGKKTNNEEVDY